VTTVAVPTRTRPAPSGAWRAWVGALAAGLVVGAACFAYQWSRGLTVTGLSNTVSWGMYIVAFMFLVGASAGGLIVVAGAELAGTRRFERLDRLAVVVSGAAIATAAGTILPDLGRPELAWKMLVQPHWTSPLVWDMFVIATYLAIAVADLYLLTRRERPAVAMRRLAMVALPVAVLVHSVTAFIFGLLVARPFWNTALLAPMFISSALVSGTALVIVVAHVVERTTGFGTRELLPDLGRLMVWFLGVDAFLLFAEVLTVYASGVEDHVEQLRVLLFGRLAPLFWFEVVAGLVVPFVILARARLRARPAWLVAACVLALTGVFLKRVNILFSSMFEPLVGLAPGIPGGRPGQQFRPDEIYVPSWVEIGVLVGMAAFFLTLVTVGVRKVVLPFAREHGRPAAGGHRAATITP
jgi:molybdopterin-containing oxidoreductase family membrane subunit